MSSHLNRQYSWSDECCWAMLSGERVMNICQWNSTAFLSLPFVALYWALYCFLSGIIILCCKCEVWRTKSPSFAATRWSFHRQSPMNLFEFFYSNVFLANKLKSFDFKCSFYLCTKKKNNENCWKFFKIFAHTVFSFDAKCFHIFILSNLRINEIKR